MIKYIKSVLWRVAKLLSYIEDARCLKVNTFLYIIFISDNILDEMSRFCIHGKKKQDMYEYTVQNEQDYVRMSNTKLMIREKAKVQDQKHLLEIIKPWVPL